VPLLASDPARDEQLRQLRDTYPVFRIQAADARADGGTVQVTFTFTAGDRMFRPSVEFSGLRPDEAARVSDPAAQRIVRALAIVEAASYWKATVSPVIEISIGAADPAEVDWWEKFWTPAMGEFLYRNGVDFTAPDFLRIATAPEGFPGAHVRGQRWPGRLLPLQPHPVAANARRVPGRWRADHGSSPVSVA
jgi:hypothetical protein